MKKAYSIRKIDNLGRIVIPMDIRKSLEIHDWDELRIRLDDDKILITKAKDSCTFCSAEEDLTPYRGKFICQKCLSELK